MAELTIQQAFEIASRQYQSGQAQDAESLYRQILGYQPDHTPTMQMLAQLAHQRGQAGEAEELLRRAIAVNSQDADAHNNLGMVLTTQGRFDDAVNSYGRALILRPMFPEAYNNLGNTLRAAGQLAQAIRAYQKALSFRPDYGDARDNLNDAQNEQDHRQQQQAAVKVEPEPTIEVPDEMLVGGGATTSKDERLAEPVVAESIEPPPPVEEPERPVEVTKAIEEEIPSEPPAAHAIDVSELQPEPLEIREAEEVETVKPELEPEPIPVEADLSEDEVIASHVPDEPVETPVEHAPSEAEPEPALDSVELSPEPAIEVEAPAAVVTHEDEAELPPVLEEAEPVQPEVEFVPHSADEFKKRGRSRWRQGRYDEAAADFHAALDVDPADTEARTDLGLIALAQGDFRQGWPAYEAKLAESWPISALPQPGWEGSELANHRILLRAEQSITDAVQFIRYAPLVGKRGGRVIVRCRPELRHLLVDQPGILLLVSTTDPMPKFYTHCPIASLPRVMGTTPEEIPADVPYLLADGKLVDKWYARVSAEPEGLKVGVALRAGQRSAPSGEDSGSPASALGSIGRVSGVRFYALQPPGEQGDPALPSGVDATDWTSSLSDLAQTAALISCLDLVITSDNVVAHLAGALGRPTWLLLPFVADWRWMIGRNDSPWYPTMRLFRQPETGNWESPAQELIAELRRKVQEQ